MGRARIPGAEGSDPSRKRKRRRRPPGLAIVERDGTWHIHGTMRARGRSQRVRQSTELPAVPETWHDADAIRDQHERGFRDQVIHGREPSVPFAVAARAYLKHRDEVGEPLKDGDVAKLEQLGAVFGLRDLDQIPDREWQAYVSDRHAGNAPATRERWLNPVVAFFTWCVDRGWLQKAPAFARNAEARKPKHRRARRVAEITPELVLFLAHHAAPHLKGQIAAYWATGGRVSSVLYHCRIADLLMAPGREQLTYQMTKNGEPVTAALHGPAVALMSDYLAWRGDLHDREAPLFVTHRVVQRGPDKGRRIPYKPNDQGFGGQTKNAFAGMKRRAIAALAIVDAAAVREAWRAGRRREAWERLRAARDLARLIAQITPHWFRHLLATTMLSLGGDLRAVMDQGGWLTAESVLAYAHDVPEHRRELVNKMVPATIAPDSKERQA